MQNHVCAMRHIKNSRKMALKNLILKVFFTVARLFALCVLVSAILCWLCVKYLKEVFYTLHRKIKKLQTEKFFLASSDKT
jgi:hypothetical protein